MKARRNVSRMDPPNDNIGIANGDRHPPGGKVKKGHADAK